MTLWKLVPTSLLAAQLCQQKFGSSAELLLKVPFRIGRNVSGPDTLRLPAELTQFSGSHCRIFYDPNVDQWLVEDTSTNGTYVDDARVQRGCAMALSEGCRLRLSSPPQDVVE
eukprot:XP_001701611.1 predicted protein [Chlamydomonas reinhardtii]